MNQHAEGWQVFLFRCSKTFQRYSLNAAFMFTLVKKPPKCIYVWAGIDPAILIAIVLQLNKS